MNILALSCAAAYLAIAMPATTEPPKGEGPVKLVSIAAYPPKVQLFDASDQKRIIIVANFADGTTREVTAQAKISLASPTILSIDQNFVLRGLQNGSSAVQISYAGMHITLPVVIQKVSDHPPISFENDVIPILTKSGCNAGTCHGAAAGKNGFHLSLYGYDIGSDHQELTRELRGRRTNLADPESSLFLNKPLRNVSHKGGRQLANGSVQHQILLDWIRQGANNDSGKTPKLTAIDIFPKKVILTGAGQRHRFLVQATYADGTARDVTDFARISSNNEPVATVDSNGEITTTENGEAFLMARFGTFAEVAQILVVPNEPDYAFPAIAANNYIDKAIYEKMRIMRVKPGPVCDDATFLRRVYLDIINKLPTPEEAREFLADTNPGKRSKLVDRLLQRPEFPDVQAMQWAELLRIESQRLERKGMHVYTEYLRDAFRTGVPFDQLVRQLLTAKGSNFRDPEANFYLVQTRPHLIAEDVAQNFLGIRVQCAQCHNHPFERWTMDDYYGLAAFFARIARKRGEHPYEKIVYPRTGGEITNARTKKSAIPTFLGGIAPKIQKNQDRRAILADWITSKTNPWFKTSVANRVWARMFGRGIVNPPDDVRVSNPPSHPELYAKLGDKLVEYKFEIRRLIQDICNSRTYQLATGQELPNSNYTQATVRRLTAEQMLDAISQVTGVAEPYRRLPAGANATQVEDGNPRNRFLDIFGRPRRTSACTCDRTGDPTLSQALHLINGPTIAKRISNGQGRLHALLRKDTKSKEILDDIYLAAYGRHPTDKERKHLLSVVDADPKTRKQAFEDTFWAMLNSKEFIFNH